jgi:hypothetical protein
MLRAAVSRAVKRKGWCCSQPNAQFNGDDDEDAEGDEEDDEDEVGGGTSPSHAQTHPG